MTKSQVQLRHSSFVLRHFLCHSCFVIHIYASMLVRLLELIRFSHTLFALPFALWAAAVAGSERARATPPVAFEWPDLLGFLFCMLFARGAALAFTRRAGRPIGGRRSQRHARP